MEGEAWMDHVTAHDLLLPTLTQGRDTTHISYKASAHLTFMVIHTWGRTLIDRSTFPPYPSPLASPSPPLAPPFSLCPHCLDGPSLDCLLFPDSPMAASPAHAPPSTAHPYPMHTNVATQHNAFLNNGTTTHTDTYT